MFRYLLAGCAAVAAAGGPVALPARAQARGSLPAGVEAVSLLGDTLRAPEQPAATRQANLDRLAAAEGSLAASPNSADALIWVGRRTAYLGRYRDAIAVFTRGIAAHPRDARMYRHRGHRWITVREFGRAVEDLQRAARLVEGRPDEVEPDGQPNARNIPTSTLQTNIFYHLGLAHYLRREDAAALTAWRRCLSLATNPDMDVAARYWVYLTLRRMGRAAEARALLDPVRPGMDIIENTGYYHLLLAFKGALPIDSLSLNLGEGLDGATTGYGLAAFLAAEGNAPQAEFFLRRARVTPSQWPSFGYIAAEAAASRLPPDLR